MMQGWFANKAYIAYWCVYCVRHSSTPAVHQYNNKDPEVLLKQNDGDGAHGNGDHGNSAPSVTDAG